MSTQLLKNVRLLDPVAKSDRTTDMQIVDGKIQAIAPHLSPDDTRSDCERLDCTGWILGAGLVDLYSQSSEPGNESRESLQSLLNAATAGGFTRLTLLPSTDPAIDNPATIEWFRTQLRLLAHSPTRPPALSLWGALTHGTQGQQMTELWELAEAGIAGFSDSKPLQSSRLLQRILEYAQPLNKPIALYCCDLELQGNGVVREGSESMRLGLPGVGAIAETAPLSVLLELLEAIPTPIHLMRVSTARSVELIAQAKAKGLPITASTCWMHLLLDVRDLQSYNPNLRLQPPLGNPSDREALAQAVREGIIDAIATDHTPYTYEEKTVAFAEAPAGAIGLELALPLLWQRFVASGEWTALTLWSALSSQPARCLGQPLAAIAPGQTAELTLFNPEQQWQVTPERLRSRSYNTPWLGETLSGCVVRTWV